MRNFKIEVRKPDYIVVLADTERFGTGETMFEGISFNECFDYIKKQTGKRNLAMTSYLIYETYTDREGRTFPVFMEVY